MAKGIVLCFKDVDPGATANDLILYAECVLTGTEAEIPGRVRSFDRLAIPIAVNNLANYPNVVEDALIALAAAQTPAVTLTRTDCLFPAYTRGA
jgi:hypothetical protein